MTEQEVKDYCESIRTRMEESGYNVGYYTTEEERFSDSTVPAQIIFTIQGPSAAPADKKHMSTYAVEGLKDSNMTKARDILDSYVKTYFSRIGKWIVDPNI